MQICSACFPKRRRGGTAQFTLKDFPWKYFETLSPKCLLLKPPTTPVLPVLCPQLPPQPSRVCVPPRFSSTATWFLPFMAFPIRFSPPLLPTPLPNPPVPSTGVDSHRILSFYKLKRNETPNAYHGFLCHIHKYGNLLAQSPKLFLSQLRRKQSTHKTPEDSRHSSVEQA